ncbi:MAG: NADH-quinone oxidoreductase subunit J [Candidatus Marinimicrobia bacterium]|jgi:NADH-quinone oxidoreductase subunit J|nr:NADH-quinone oxidoreductase subunit J [Candidatus Neomarinimicrobiota bacterium]|tara:strand:+ start:477 stop:965 length:489 start_codon:yes stop_codon:yes gene_type:complete
MAEITFWFIAGLTIVSAVMVVYSKKLLNSAIALLFTLFGVAGLYVFLWADFLAAVQVVVYIGGILILIIFGIMLTNRITTVHISHSSIQRGYGGMVVVGLMGFLGWMIVRTPWLQKQALEPEQTVATIGRLLLTDYLMPFEVTSVLLLGALIGAATLSRAEE